jgi:phospholipid transport system transporter-binding protein
MISQNGSCAAISGAMTLTGATALLAEGNALISATTDAFDLAGVSEVDSSGLAVLFGWVREAKRLGRTITVRNPPTDLLSLAEVYGVSDLLPLA